MPKEVFLRFEQDIKRFLLQRLECAALAEDIYQSLLERALRQPELELENPKAYLFRAAANAVNDYYRAQSSRERYSNEVQQNQDLLIDTQSPERVVAATQMISVIENALGELPQLTQKIFYLYRLEGLTQQAIAQQLGISRSTVERHLAKAVSHWKKRVMEDAR